MTQFPAEIYNSIDYAAWEQVCLSTSYFFTCPPGHQFKRQTWCKSNAGCMKKVDESEIALYIFREAPQCTRFFIKIQFFALSMSNGQKKREI